MVCLQIQHEIHCTAFQLANKPHLYFTVDGKSSVCLICMKYRIIFLIIIIISLGQILLSYIANTSRTHEWTHAHACACTRACTNRRRSGYCYSMGLWHTTVTARSTGDNGWSLAIEINTGTGGPVSPRFRVFFAYKKILGRTETRTRDRMYYQYTNSLRHLPRRSSNNSDLQFANCDRQTYGLEENYSIDYHVIGIIFHQLNSLSSSIFSCLGRFPPPNCTCSCHS